MYYLRFTQNAEREIKNKEVSYLKTPSMKKAKKLSGLCAFSLSATDDKGRPTINDRCKILDEELLLQEIEMIVRNQTYLDTSVAVLFHGQYLDTNPNGEGVIIKPLSIVKEFYFS